MKPGDNVVLAAMLRTMGALNERGLLWGNNYPEGFFLKGVPYLKRLYGPRVLDPWLPISHDEAVLMCYLAADILESDQSYT